MLSGWILAAATTRPPPSGLPRPTPSSLPTPCPLPCLAVDRAKNCESIWDSYKEAIEECDEGQFTECEGLYDRSSYKSKATGEPGPEVMKTIMKEIKVLGCTLFQYQRLNQQIKITTIVDDL